MRTSRHRTSASLAATILMMASVALAGSADDAQTQWMRLARTSDVVVAGECVAERSGWDDTAGLIVTTIEFRPRRFYKGELARVLTVKTLGGRVGDESMTASHGASLAGGEQVLLFLKRSEFGSYFIVTGGEAGKVPLAGFSDDAGGPPTMGTLDELTRLLSRISAAQ